MLLEEAVCHYIFNFVFFMPFKNTLYVKKNIKLIFPCIFPCCFDMKNKINFLKIILIYFQVIFSKKTPYTISGLHVRI